MPSRTNAFAAGVMTLAMAVAPLALSADKKTADKKAVPSAKARKNTTPSSAQGMVVVQDPATGQLRPPTAEEFQALQGTSGATGARTTPNRGPLANRQVQRPDGSTSLALDQSTDVFAVATIAPDGKLVMGEVTGVAAAKAAVSRTAKPANSGKVASNNEK